MAIIHFSRREIEARVVYWGPALSGKTTSLRALHAFTPRGRCGDLETLDTVDERTVYFDYLPLMWGTIAGFQGRVKVLGVPGQPLYHQTRRVLLRGADAVVFVADSGAQRLSANVESLRELQQALAELGRSLDELPMVLQYNKRDLPEALPTKVLQLGLNPGDLPWFETVATEGRGVADVFQALFDLLSLHVERDLASGDGAQLRGSGGAAPVPDREEVHRTLGEVIAVRQREEEEKEEAAPAPRPTPTPPTPSEPCIPSPEDPALPAPVPPTVVEATPPEAPLPEAPPPETGDLPFDLPADGNEEEPPSTEETARPRSAVTGQDLRADPLVLEGLPASEPPAGPPAPESPAEADRVPAPAHREAARFDESTPPHAVVTLPYLPRDLLGCEVYSVAEPILERDDTVIVRLTLREPQSGRHRRVRVRLVRELSGPQGQPLPPAPASQESYRAMLLLVALISFAFGVVAAWALFLHG